LPEYKGPRDAANKVTPELLFRGGFEGETVGPYMSQFLLQPTALGALPIDQKYVTNKSHADFMLDPVEFQQVQNGIGTGKVLIPGAALYFHDGRGLSAYTHVDVLYQSYFMAYLVLNSPAQSNGGVAWNLNPGNPYVAPHPGAKTQNGFASLGQPDIAAAVATAAAEAIKAVWYQKWWVHLRHRPESGGAIVHLQKTGQGGSIEAQLSNTVLNSQAVAASYAANGNSYFLSQAFPEGSPTHPSYPTGHGAVAGACITVLKFFFDGMQQFEKPLVPSGNGTALNPYVPPPGQKLTVNGELNKLAHNISFGHGIHAGIHWRSDTDTSIQFGEAVALGYLRDKVKCYNEKFSSTLTKVDGTQVTLSNM
jgi:hypothetical protein